MELETGELTSTPEILDGLPHVSLPLPSTAPLTLPTTVTLMAAAIDIRRIARALRHTESGTHERLPADAVEDIFVVCQYSAA